MRLSRARAAAPLLAAAVLFSRSAAAQSGGPVLQVNVPVDVSITALSLGALLATEVSKADFGPAACKLCDPPSIDSAVRDALRWDSTKGPNALSYVTGFGLAPLSAFGLDAAAVLQRGGTAGEWAEDVLVITEALAISGDINQLVKVLAARERPYAHALAPGQKSGSGSDRNMSFYSGHTNLAFTTAVAGGTIASLKGYPSAPWIWASGLTIAALTGYLRIAADRHYLLDVVAGAVAGSAVGALIPLLHRPAPQAALSVSGLSPSPMAASPVIGIRGTW